MKYTKRRGCKYTYTSQEEKRKRIKEGKVKHLHVDAFYDLFPEEFERIRNKIMNEEEQRND